MKINIENKWMRAAIPALLIHMSVGTVYCWSTFKQAISETIGMSPFSVGWGFSLAIFFLGMSAAFAGRFVEKDIKTSSQISCICFSAGMVGTGIVLAVSKGIVALIGIYLCYGVIMGIGLGIGYLTPVKTLMLWFKENKGLATGISIMGFGLAKAIASPIMLILQQRVGIASMFIILGFFYCSIMCCGHLLLKKPDGWIEPIPKKAENPFIIFKDKTFLGIWLMFFINIHCGLMIIAYERQILNAFFGASVILIPLIAVVPSLTAGANALGRIGYSTISDKLSQRNYIYQIIFISSIVASILAYFCSAYSCNIIFIEIIIITFLLIINAGYGGGFSTLPALLSERFGMKKISQIHGLALSAWAVAGVTGNNLSEILLNKFNNYNAIFITSLILYIVAFGICVWLVSNKNSSIEID